MVFVVVVVVLVIQLFGMTTRSEQRRRLTTRSVQPLKQQSATSAQHHNAEGIQREAYNNYNYKVNNRVASSP
jgi:hypothetical protein